MSAKKGLDLVDELIRRWTWDYSPDLEDFYCDDLLPGIVDGSRLAELADWETALVDQLRDLLSPSEWQGLPKLVRQRRHEQLEELKSDREREAEEKAEEQRRQEAEKRAKERIKKQQQADDEARQMVEQARIREEEARHRIRQELVVEIEKQLRTNFLSADSFYRHHPKKELLDHASYAKLKANFIQHWAEENLDLDLDLEQATAVGTHGGDVKVVARAGSGKTRTLVARAAFLLKHCGVDARKMLLLAFNKDAAKEMRERLSKMLDEDMPYVMTFHALAYALVHPRETLVYDDVSSGNEILSREIQRIIDQHLQSDEYRPLIRDLMLKQFREDWEQIVEGQFHLPIDELIQYRRSLPRESLNGEYVKSYGERLIANTLFEHDIEYKYERNYRWSGTNYRPDFTILLPERRGIVIEYFGLEGDPDYDGMSQRKREFWAQRQGWTLIEFSPSHITSRGDTEFAIRLLQQLNELGVVGRLLSDEELWESIRERATDRFTGAMRSFVSRCRKRNLTLDDLQAIVDRHTPITEAESLFLTIGASVYSAYLQRLIAGKEDDFDGLMWRAVAETENGNGRFAREKGRQRGDLRDMQYIMVDEFQDFSEMFYKLVQGIRGLNPGVELFCVGDDWQAINGFAGSELRFFEHFEKYFRDTATRYVTKNYRSPAAIVEVGNALMVGRGNPAEANQQDHGWVRTGSFCDFSPSAVEKAKHDGDEATPAVLRLVKHLLDIGQDVVMLSRRNNVPWYVSFSDKSKRRLDGLERFADHVRSLLPEEDRGRIEASTAHKYKGREKDAVIILDANEGCYPLVHPNWVFLRVFGDSVKDIIMEERRLFYVALTRSQHSLAILCDGPKLASEYLGGIRDQMKLDHIEWAKLPAVPSLDGERLEVRVLNGFGVREQLKQMGYRFNGAGKKYWSRSVMAEGFDFEAFCRQSWALSGITIEIYSESGELLERKL